MYPSQQVNGLHGYLGEVRQGPYGELYQLGEVMDERGNIGLGWQPYSEPQLGEVRRGADGQLYQYGVDGLGNVGFAPLLSLAASALPSIAQAVLPSVAKALPSIAQAIPGVSNLVQSLLPTLRPPSLPFPSAPVTASVPVPTPGPAPLAVRQWFPGYTPGYLSHLVPRIADATAQKVVEKLEPLLARRRRRGRRGVGGVGEDPYVYGVGEREYDSLGVSGQDMGIAYDDLGETEPYLNDSMGYSDYEPMSGMDGYVKGPVPTGPAFVPREPPSELWKPLW